MALFATPLAAATITVINNDAAGQGFNDNTARAATGGNPGTTLGARRLFAFNFAADLLGDKIESAVAIRVLASFSPLQCSSNRGTLGQAGAQVSVVLSPDGGEDSFFPIALANAISGRDLAGPGNSFGAPETDIGAEFNGAIDNNDNCLRNINWYYGVDGNPPPGTLDFLSTVTHELIHGLGFSSATDLSSGGFPDNVPGIFDRFIRDLDRNALWPQLSAGQRRASATNFRRVVFDGPSTSANGAPTLAAGTAANKVLLYTPSPLESGSSVSHWDTSLNPNALMEPFETGDDDVNNGIGLSSCMLQDIGWQLSPGVQCPDRPGASAPVLALNPASVSFGGVTTGSSASRTLTISNQGSANLIVQNLVAPGTPFSLQPQSCGAGTTLPPGGNCSLSLGFSPTQQGNFSDSLGVATNAGNRSVALSGNGQAPPAPSIAVTPVQVNFGARTVGSSTSRQVTVSNAGNAPLQIGSLGAPDAPFSLPGGQDNCSGRSLAAGAQCIFSVVFAPGAAGNFSAQVIVPSNDRNLSVGLSGSAAAATTAPRLSVTPGSVAFGAVIPGQSAQAQINLRNSGDANLQLQSIQNPAVPFSVVSQTCNPPRSFAPNTSCVINLRFAPSQAGSFNGQLRINSDGGNATVALSGSGMAAQAPMLQVTPGMLDFGERTLGSVTTRNITVSNTGNAPLQIGSLGGANPPFSIPAGSDNCSASTLAAQAQCTVAVVFEPTTDGLFAANLSVPSNDRNVNVTLGGVGREVSQPNIDVDPAALDFGNVGISSTTSRVITVRNTGTSALVVGNVPANQPPVVPFTITDQDCANRELAINVACEIEVQIAPQSSGQFADSLVIASNDPARPIVVVQLRGAGVTDADTDGVPDATENAGPNGGDGNNDNIPDSNQADVVSLTGMRGGFVTLVTSNGVLSDVRALNPPSRIDLPENVNFANGFFAFSVTGLSPGARADVSLILDTSQAPDSYYKYNEQSQGVTPAVRFDFDPASGTGARIDGNRVTLSLIDGGRGDADMLADGQITDPGAPGTTGAPTARSDDSGSGGGGGCALSNEPRNFAPMLPLLLLCALSALLYRRRRYVNAWR